MTYSKGHAPDRRGKGEGYRWLADRAGYTGDDCLLWPFNAPNGYGVLGHLGEMHYAHRFMCELTKGPAPSERHEAAHECGNSLCCNPKHLSWKTPSENQSDRAEHGTKSRGPMGKLTFEQAQEIRALRGIKTQEQIAAMYGVTRSNVSHIQRGKHMTRQPKGFDVSRGGNFSARIIVDQKVTRLGTFKTEAEARAVFLAARERVKAGLPPKAA